ncbi:hypothetical protein R1flu_026317 [Riccia fluitans]|uniref:Uncharacterized protein n=1 Tax=Riccia fluitans TaxID=41844 RepID=A0ABD1XFL8_9MARC
MRIKMDGHLVEPLDPNVDATSQKKNKKKQTGFEQPSQKRPRFESDPKDGNERNFPSTVKTSWKGKEKVTESSHLPDVDTDMDIAAEERRTLKKGVKANHLEMDPPLSTPIGQTSGREHHGRANQRLASLEEDLVHVKREEEKLKATIEALKKEKSEMNAKVALMERKDLYELLEAKMEGFQIANYPGMIKVAIETLPNSLAVFDYMRNIFDSYVNPTNDPNVQPLVKGLDADDFSMDKFFGLQDPTSPNDVQASPNFEDLRTNECLRLRAEVRNLGAKPQ